MAMTRAAVFLDKDGTLVHDVPYNVDPDRVRLVPGAGEALAMLRDAGFALIVVSNQSGVAEGRFRLEALRGVEARMAELLRPHRVDIAGWYWCPHAAAVPPVCTCRKPAPGLLLRAAEDWDIDLAASWMVGDILNDIEAGRRAGCRGVLVDCGNEDRWETGAERVPHAIVSTLPAAARWITGSAGADVPREALACAR